MAAVYLSPTANNAKEDPPTYTYIEGGTSPHQTTTSPVRDRPAVQNAESPSLKSCQIFLFVVISLIIGCAIGCLIMYIGMQTAINHKEASEEGILATTETTTTKVLATTETKESVNVIDDIGNTTCAGTIPVQATGCPPLWTHFQGNCYRFFGQCTTWLEAEEHCKSYFNQYQAHLVSIHSQEESDFVFKLWQDSLISTSQIDSSILRPSGHSYGPFDCIFMGLNDIADEGVFVWTDGTPNDYNEWGPASPSDGGIGGSEDCTNWIQANLGLTFAPWNDIPCSSSLLMPYVCKLRL